MTLYKDKKWGGEWNGKLTAAGMPTGFGFLKFVECSKARADKIHGYFGFGFPTGSGWVREEYRDGKVYEGFMEDGDCSGQGCLWEADGSFSQGLWKKHCLVDGALYKADGSRPLQYQCKIKQSQSVLDIAKLLARRLQNAIDPSVLADQIVKKNRHRPGLTDLTKYSSIGYHTILLLPDSLKPLLDSRACGDCPGKHSQSVRKADVVGPHAESRPLDFLKGSTIEVDPLRTSQSCPLSHLSWHAKTCPALFNYAKHERADEGAAAPPRLPRARTRFRNEYACCNSRVF